MATGYARLPCGLCRLGADAAPVRPLAVHRSAVGLVTGTRPTMRDMLTTLTIERTFIRGDHGEPLVDAEGLAAAGVTVVTIDDSGHVMMDDQPAAFVEALAAALPDTPVAS